MMRKTAILVIDVQNAYLPGQKWACASIAEAIPNIKKLCSERKDALMLFTRHVPSRDPQGTWMEYNRLNVDVNADSWLNELTDDMKELVAESGAPVIDKSLYSAWKAKEVRAMLEGVDAVVVAGVVAECCVLSTVFDLIDAGKYVFYLVDAISGVNGEVEAATVAVLKGLEYVHLRITTTEDYLKASALS